MNRLILQQLKAWKYKKGRKPLILKGVRQTGKTYILQAFGSQEFNCTHYINFEFNRSAHKIFEKDLDPRRILKELSFIFDKSIDIKNDLLIFDEIQACPTALTSLKYFCEELPELALCSAGSLLGLHLNESSFPVGKVDFLHMYPLSFLEFMEANEDFKSLEYLNEASINTASFPAFVHDHIWQLFKIYLITGGLPEVVQTYLNHKTDLFSALTLVRQKQQELIFGYYADIAKHSGKVNAMHIDRVWRAIPQQLAQAQDGLVNRFQFKGIIPGIDRYQRLANVIDWLLAAELVIKESIVEHIELPLTAYVKETRFKLFLFDVGILGALGDLTPKSILDYDYGTYKGYFAENFVAQEFIANGIKNLFSWQSNRAEVEFLYAESNQVIPIEVKSGWVLHNQSLKKYAEKYHPPYRTTFSARPLNIDIANNYHQYPIYMVSWFPLRN